ncbi:flavin-dependent oxidoreductase [Amycolatopsis anabasis]|uniref:flavin-dependent oxidoreductase n=1 Tax=Amycolatopsis anabasis TaxID=1840409 RepID=UPI00131EACA1|nr:flavin-dependent oxidoreductase [Amycolatopsis anabasis]
MRVIVAGGGIGGLATALSLHAAGIEDVLVAEAAEEIRPLGVGINLLPHAVRELTELGVADRIARIGVATAELAYFNRFGQAIWSEPRGVAVGYRWPQYSVHRGKLQMLLLDLVRERLGPEAVRTGMRLTGFSGNAEGAVATFGEERLECDLLIAADGIRSTVRSILHPDEGAPPWNGLVLWRGTTVGKPYLTGRSMIMAGDGTEKFVAYPISEPDADGQVLINWIAERPLGREAVGRGDWNRPVEVAEILAHFGDWRFDWLDVPGIIGAAQTAYEYPMVDRDPLPRWTHGRVTLLGDAAHAMYPIGSNGASQAILDARVLAHALATHADPDAGLAAYENERRPPTTAIQLANRQMGPEVVMKLAHERAPTGFDDIDQVVPLAEREEIALRYKRTAGFDPALLNERPSYSV